MATSQKFTLTTLDTIYYYEPEQGVNTFDSWELATWNCPGCSEKLAAYYINICGHNSRDTDAVTCPKCQNDSMKMRSTTYLNALPIEELLVKLANDAIAAQYADKKLISPNDL